MRKLTAIFFFFLFLFNLVGYRLFFLYAEQKADARIESQIIGEQYGNEDLLKLEVDMNMPYLTADSDFERVSGEITIEGKVYTFVKRKVENGKLVLLCLPDQDKTNLRTAKNDFFKSANSLNQENDTEKSSKQGMVKAPLSEYDRLLTFCIEPYPSSRLVITSYEPIAKPSDKHSLTPEQPPELI